MPVAETIEDVAQSLWPLASPVLESRDWLALPRWADDGVGYLTADGSLLPVREVREPHAWPAMNLVDVCAGDLHEPAPRAVAAARAAGVPHLLVGSPGYHTVPVGDRSAEALAVLADAVERHARSRGMTWGYAHLPPEADELVRVLRARGYRIGVVSATARLDLPGGGFEGYLAMLRKHRRTAVRRERELLRESGVVVHHTAGAGTAELLPTVAALEAMVHAQHGSGIGAGPLVAMHQDYLRRFGDRMHVLYATADGEPLGSVVAFAGDQDLVVRTIGLDERPLVREACVYFNLGYYAAIELAYRLGVGRVVFGPRALEAKVLRGAHTVPLRVALPPEAPRPLADLLDATDEATRCRFPLPEGRP